MIIFVDAAWNEENGRLLRIELFICAMVLIMGFFMVSFYIHTVEISITSFIYSVPSNLMRIDYHADAPFSIKEDIDGLYYGYIAFTTVITFSLCEV